MNIYRNCVKKYNFSFHFGSFSYLCSVKQKTEETMRKSENLHIVYNNLSVSLLNKEYFAAAQAAVEE